MSAIRTRVRFADDVEKHERPRKKLRLESRSFPGREQPAKSSHRFGVLPSGNAFLSGRAKNIRPKGLGHLKVLPDHVLLLFLASLDALSLRLLGGTSRALYAYTSHEPLWKDLYISQSQGSFLSWEGTWKRTYLCSFSSIRIHPLPPAPDIDASGLYSDELFQPNLCARTSLTSYFTPHTLRPRTNITHDDGRELSPAVFSDRYAKRSRPLIISRAIEDWPAYKENLWTVEMIQSRFHHVAFRAEAFDVPFHIYRQYMEDCDEEDAPLYLFDSHFVEKTGCMGDEYLPFPWLDEDFFELLGDERPDHRWLIVGPARSGSTFHKDPNGTSAWNAVLTGSKGWIMFPPDICPPGVYINEDESEVTSPLSIPEWFLTYFDHAWATYGPSAKDAHLRGKMIVGVCKAGEVVYVPSGWWHLVVNLEESVAVTQNFVSSAELRNVISFMRDKPDQMSGFKGGLTPGEIVSKFKETLARERPSQYEEVASAFETRSTSSANTIRDAGETAFTFSFEIDEEMDDGE